LTFQKYGPTPTSNGASIYYTPNGMSVAGNTVTYSNTDNGLGDDTFTGADGVINDPAVPVSFAAIAAGIPTLSEWGMIILSGLLALGTLVALRRRQSEQAQSDVPISLRSWRSSPLRCLPPDRVESWNAEFRLLGIVAQRYRTRCCASLAQRLG
jgi:hypothetical protein